MWSAGLCSFRLQKLFTETKSLDDGTIAIDVAVVEVVEKRTALTYQLCQSSCSSIIFTVLLKMFRQVGNTV